jgi:hypothetical protein
MMTYLRNFFLLTVIGSHINKRGMILCIIGVGKACHTPQGLYIDQVLGFSVVYKFLDFVDFDWCSSR